MKPYESPRLFVDEYVTDTMIASSGSASSKNGINSICSACDTERFGALNVYGKECVMSPQSGMDSYTLNCT